jgi:hypothetical protein
MPRIAVFYPEDGGSRLHGVKLQKTVNFTVTAVRAVNITKESYVHIGGKTIPETEKKHLQL